jgi:hypothetical protein
MSDGAAGWRFALMKRTLRVRAVAIGALEELPFICPVQLEIRIFDMGDSYFECD